MAQLLATYSVAEILIFIILLAIAVKGVVTFWDWGTERLRKIFHKETQQELDRDKINQIAEKQEKLFNDLQEVNRKIGILVDSDKDDIKAFITDKHHYFCYEKKWIDDYSLDCIERRYSHYKDEGGNSFIATLMGELKALPKQPPQH